MCDELDESSETVSLEEKIDEKTSLNLSHEEKDLKRLNEER